MGRRGIALAGLAAVLMALWAWRTWWPSDPEQIRRRMQSFSSDFNEGTAEGLGTVARAAKIASYFTDDVVVEFGKGAPPIHGRETLIGMATRLQPRTAVFTLELLDVNVEMQSGSTAEVNLTAAFRRRTHATGEESIDARELLVTMVKADGDWRASRVRTVDPFDEK